MAGLLGCLKPDVIVLRGDAGFHNGLRGEYVLDGTHGGKRRYRFTGGPYKGRDTVFLLWSAVDNAWMVRAPRDAARKLRASVPWISCKPIIRNGPGTTGPQDVPRDNWVLVDNEQRAAAPKLLVLKVRPGQGGGGGDGCDGDDDIAAASHATPMREVEYDRARWLCRYLGWTGAHQFYMGRTYHGFAMLQSLGFLGLGWVTDVVMFDTLYVAPPPPPRDTESKEHKQWVEEYGEPAPAPTRLSLPMGLRLEFHDYDVARAVAQLAFAWAYEMAFRVFLQYSSDTYMLVWALKVLGCCVGVWLVGSIGGVRASIAAMAQAVAVVVGVCAMLLRFPIWAPQFAFLVRLGIIVVYFFTRRLPRRAATTTTSSSSNNNNKSNSSGGGRGGRDGYVFHLSTAGAKEVAAVVAEGPPPPVRVAHDLKRAVALSALAQVGFLLLAGISHASNTMIVCAYRERLSLRELIVIAVKEHGLNIPKVVSLTRNLITAWREDCWDGLYGFLDEPKDGDVLYAQFTRPFEVLGLKPTATLRQVKSAYRKLALEHHPDKSKEDFSDEVFVQIQEAYAQLKKRFHSPSDKGEL